MWSLRKAPRAILLLLLVQSGVLWLFFLVGFPAEVHFLFGSFTLRSKIHGSGAELRPIQLPQSRSALAKDGTASRQGVRFLQIKSTWLLVENASVSLVSTANTSSPLPGPFNNAPSLRNVDPSTDAPARSAAFARWQARSAAQRVERLLFIVDGDTENNPFHQIAKNLLTPLAAALQAWGAEALKAESLVLALPDPKVGAAMARFSLHTPFFGKTVWPGDITRGLGLGYHYFEDVVVTPRGIDFWNRLDSRGRDAQALKQVADFIREQFLQHFKVGESPEGDGLRPVAVKYISRGNYPPHLQAIRVTDTHPSLINVSTAPKIEPELGYNPSAAGRQVVNEADVLKGLRSLDSEGVVTVEAKRLEQLSLRDQLEFVHAADVLICPHGAGCVWFLFARPGTMAIELFPCAWADPVYRNLAHLASLNYVHQIADEDRCFDRHWIKRDRFMVISGRSSPYEVDIPNLLEATRVGIRMAKVAGARLWFECIDYMLMRKESGSKWERLPPFTCKRAFFRDTAMLVNVSDHSIPFKPYDRIE